MREGDVQQLLAPAACSLRQRLDARVFKVNRKNTHDVFTARYGVGYFSYKATRK